MVASPRGWRESTFRQDDAHGNVWIDASGDCRAPHEVADLTRTGRKLELRGRGNRTANNGLNGELVGRSGYYVASGWRLTEDEWTRRRGGGRRRLLTRRWG
jgi:hypothetical protein